MRSIVHHEFGDPTSVLAVEEAPLPEPGPGEARVRLLLSPIHNHDLWTVRGTYGYKPELPARAGTEAVGVVDALGEGVEGLEVGQRVATGGTFGVWSEQFLAKAAALIPVPDGIPDEAAAQLVAMPFSAISLLDSLGLEEGDWMIQNAANGAVGRLVAQLAPSRGIHVIGLVRRADGVAEMAAAGIDQVVATDSEGWQDEVRRLAGDSPLKVGIDSLGGDASGDVLSLLGEEGTLISFGAMASPTMNVSSGDVIFKQATVKGFWGSKVSAAMPADARRRLMGELMARLADGTLTLPVGALYPLDQIGAAAAANFEPGRTGKILLMP